ncbi:hypothetical protein AVDCRST_MAG84-4188, partial [uncultured Microcoleus sp.]
GLSTAGEGGFTRSLLLYIDAWSNLPLQFDVQNSSAGVGRFM